MARQAGLDALGAAFWGAFPIKGVSTMSIEKNKELVLRFLNEFMIEHKIEVLDEILGPTYTQHNPVIDDSKEGLIAFFQDFWKKYPRPGVPVTISNV
jgi:predicted SnoaL-like aldol condensation-catalyzing enzyme